MYNGLSGRESNYHFVSSIYLFLTTSTILLPIPCHTASRMLEAFLSCTANAILSAKNVLVLELPVFSDSPDPTGFSKMINL